MTKNKTDKELMNKVGLGRLREKMVILCTYRFDKTVSNELFVDLTEEIEKEVLKALRKLSDRNDFDLKKAVRESGCILMTKEGFKAIIKEKDNIIKGMNQVIKGKTLSKKEVFDEELKK